MGLKEEDFAKLAFWGKTVKDYRHAGVTSRFNIASTSKTPETQLLCMAMDELRIPVLDFSYIFSAWDIIESWIERGHHDPEAIDHICSALHKNGEAFNRIIHRMSQDGVGDKMGNGMPMLLFAHTHSANMLKTLFILNDWTEAEQKIMRDFLRPILKK